MVAQMYTCQAWTVAAQMYACQASTFGNVEALDTVPPPSGRRRAFALHAVVCRPMNEE